LSTTLEIKDLTFGYSKDRLLFEGLSLTLRRGEIKAVVGKSGAGKSTLFELILGNLKPISGTITTSECSEVFQDPYTSFHPSYSIIEQIKDVASLEKMEQFLPSLDLSLDLLSKLPHELSGGQLQRSSILRALLMDRSIMLLDEPTSALDNITQLNTMKMLIAHLKTSSMLIITHDHDLAKWCADETIILI